MSPETAIAMRYTLQRGAFNLDVDVEIPLHGITGVYGRSGAGKTSLLRCIAGLEQPASGRLVVAGDTWQGSGKVRAVHERAIGYVFQEPSLFEHLDVRANIAFGMQRIPAAERRVSMEEAVELLGVGPLLERLDALIEQRNIARQKKDWAESDRIRDELKAQGVILEDGAAKTTWRRE